MTETPEGMKMHVVIDGVVYEPRIQADIGGRAKSIATLMTEGRTHKHLTLKQAAKLSGVSIAVICNAECGSMTLKTAVALCELYGIPFDQLARAVRRT